MRRVLRLGRGYLRGIARLKPRGATATALAATLRSLEAAEVLPGPLDGETMIPPVRRAWFRRVAAANLWVLYDARDGEVILLALVGSPPIPVGD